MLQLLQRTSAPKFSERLDQHGRLNGHVQAAGNPGAGQRLRLAILLPQGHQARHFAFGQLDLFATPIGQGQVRHFIGQFRFDRRHKRLR